MHKELWQQLVKLDAGKTAAKAQCQYSKESNTYTIPFLNTVYTVDTSAKEIYSTSNNGTEFVEQLCILAYLINAADIPENGKLVKPDSLAGGEFFFKRVHSLDTGKLENVFGECPELLHSIAEQFDAGRCEFGDASIKLYALPRLPLIIVVWQSDDEFPPRASILFDKTADKQLPLDALLAVTNHTIKTLIQAAGVI